MIKLKVQKQVEVELSVEDFIEQAMRGIELPKFAVGEVVTHGTGLTPACVVGIVYASGWRYHLADQNSSIFSSTSGLLFTGGIPSPSSAMPEVHLRKLTPEHV